MAKLDPHAHTIQERRLYGYFCNKTGKLLYIGSSTCLLKTLEYNHRNCFTKYPGEKQTRFRTALQNKIKDGTFRTLIEFECNRVEIEDLEGQLIRAFKPPYNWDKDPVASSLREGRYRLNNLQ
jgi:hypothetical protein